MLVSSPSPRRSPLHLDALQGAAGPAWTVQLHAEAGSTNALAAADPVRDLLVVADHQQAGRGRLDRVWKTPPGAALTFSAVVEPQVDAAWWPLLPLVAGLAVARAVGSQASLKWPNDVLLGEQKVCGILVEALPPTYAVIGIGINVDQTREELPVPSATSLTLAGISRERTELFGDVVDRLRYGLGMLLHDPHSVSGDYATSSATLGQQVRVDLPGGATVAGTAVQVDLQGRLVVRTDPPDPTEVARPGDLGRTVVVGAGDVVHVRPLF